MKAVMPDGSRCFFFSASDQAKIAGGTAAKLFKFA
jgi:hypothetical protein